MKEGKTPFKVHLLVCVNDRQGERASCQDKGGSEIRALLKEGVEIRGLKPRVRVSGSGCLGLCGTGPTVIAYPQGVLFAKVEPGDVESILDRVGSFLEE